MPRLVLKPGYGPVLIKDYKTQMSRKLWRNKYQMSYENIVLKLSEIGHLNLISRYIIRLETKIFQKKIKMRFKLIKKAVIINLLLNI